MDIPDEGMDVINHYGQNPEWEPAVVISNERGSYGERMARITGVPVDEFPRLEALVPCNLVVIGEASSHLAPIREMLAGTKVEVALLEEVRQRITGESEQTATEPPADPTQTGIESTPGLGGLVADLDAAMSRALNLAPETETAPSLPDVPAAEENAEENPESMDIDMALENFGPKDDAGDSTTPIAIVGIERSDVADEIEEDDDEVGFHEIEEPVVDLKVVGDTYDEFKDTGAEEPVTAAEFSEELETSETEEPTVWEIEDTETEDIEEPVTAAEVSEEPEMSETEEPTVWEIEDTETEDIEQPEEPTWDVDVQEPAPAAPIDDLDARQQALVRQLDRAMALEMSFSERLSAIAEILQSALGADYAHLFVIDSVSQKLELLTEPKGITGAGGKSRPIDEGLFRWLIQHGGCHLATLSDSRSSEGRGMAFLVINTAEPYGLLVLESFPVEAGQEERVRGMLKTVVDEIEEIFEVEQGLETQDIIAQIRMRITNRTAKLAALPPDLRTQPALEIAVEELGGNVAVWIPAPAIRPIITQPRNRDAAKILAEAWDKLDGIAQCTREKGSSSWGPEGSDWERTGPEGPAPYISIQGEDGEGVLVFFFPEGEGETSAQLPLRVLSEALSNVVEILQKTASPGAMSVVELEGEGDGTDTILTEDELQTRISHETARSKRTGLPFALTRFVLEAPAEEHQAFLRHFLLTSKRESDILAECEDGSMVILSPDTHGEATGLRNRFSERWKTRGPDLELVIETVAHPAENGHAALIGEEAPQERKTA